MKILSAIMIFSAVFIIVSTLGFYVEHFFEPYTTEDEGFNKIFKMVELILPGGLDSSGILRNLGWSMLITLGFSSVGKKE
ncbi:hypothetical protein COV93_06745 [Candidatus Woesearchaeota archaeon CG11_big_fil_rev_8_21_14_0_20_43_8]|nr:MAG: hypothetical protein COV93_06745 [Candidatus Woesearchaeota archaeon CG11_big_fil_rev_8_21_14_0_20_43_8]PIO04964.1 MAG: hypothetical protein COT47_06785 [Candidatus Woesearchaeota archaeon CG08_land_8_20_14_0_20_43_7]